METDDGPCEQPRPAIPVSRPIYYLMPSPLFAEAERRAAGRLSVQHLVTLTLAMAWGIPPPPLRKKGEYDRRIQE